MLTNKSKTKRKKTIKKRKKIISISLLILILLLLIFTSYKQYINYKCKNLYYSVDYNLTHGENSKSVMRVIDMKLIFSDKDSAVVIVEGFSKESPHKSLELEAHFTKNKSNVWVLENIYSLT
ncbi:MAG: hypothetical protein GX275_13340 [Clostridiales bacterium]|nr:hypothetical protein [Clostridiales bacterium]